jgi:putative ABC transport system permease protein
MSTHNWRGLRRVFRIPLGWMGVKADVDAELTFHIQGRIDELMGRGLSRQDAEAETRRLFGDYARIESEVERIDRGMTRRRTIAEHAEACLADVRYAVRTLAHQPVFAGVVVLTLTLGIGATTAIFHVVDRVVLHPLPYPEPARIVYVGWSWRGKGNYAGALSPQKFVFFHDQSHIFDGLVATRGISGTVGETSSGASARGLLVTEDFFRVLKVQPARGRAFIRDEFAPDAPSVAILGHALWTTRFGGDPNVIGREFRLDDRPYTIVGIMPESFELAEETESSGFLVPLRFTETDLADAGSNYLVIGRLRNGVTESQAKQDLALAFDRYRATFPDIVAKEGDTGPVLFTYRSLFVSGLEPLLWILLVATLFVLLLGCANVANLLLARALSRQREFAVRTALGAGRGRIVRQVVIEALLLGVVSAVIASVVSLAGVRGLVALSHGSMMRDTQLAVDQRALWFTTLIAVTASLGIGLAAALPATRIDLARSLSEGARGGSPSRRQRGLRNALVATESAIAMILLAGAGLLIASFVKLRAVDPGFVLDGIVTARIAHAPAGYDSAAAVDEFERRVLERLRATPGITSVGATSSLPLVRGLNTVMTLDGNDEAKEGGLEWRAVSPGYFQTFGIKVLRGRQITDADSRLAPPIVLVSKSFADKWWPGENPLGRRIRIGKFGSRSLGKSSGDPAREIVGVVADMKDMALEQLRPRHTVWVPQAQTTPSFLSHVSLPSFAVRATDIHAAATALRAAIQDADPRMGAPEISAMRDVASSSSSYQQRWFTLVLMSLFAAVALGLTSVGIYGVVAYSAARRVHEIGVRMALGARPANVVVLVVGQGMRPVILGLAGGLLAALALSRLLTKMLFGVSPHDPRTLAVVALVLTAVALLASYLPARRATRVDPLTALRSE